MSNRGQSMTLTPIGSSTAIIHCLVVEKVSALIDPQGLLSDPARTP
jgi:hypothetical protein